MGCSGSKEDTQSQNRATIMDTAKSTCLIFGMPDSGQTIFIKSIEKCFYSVGGFNQTPFIFHAVDTSRASRDKWIQEYTNKPRVIASFFFMDISSPGAVLLSIKTLNWMRSMMVDITPPHVVAYVKNPKDMINFTTLKDYLAPGVEASTFNDTSPSDIQRYVEYVTGCAAKHAGPPMLN